MFNRTSVAGEKTRYLSIYLRPNCGFYSIWRGLLFINKWQASADKYHFLKRNESSRVRLFTHRRAVLKTSPKWHYSGDWNQLFHWAENCYWIWSWIIGSYVPNATPQKKGGVMFYCHTQTNDILKLSGRKWRGYCWTGHCSPLYMSRIRQAVGRQSGEDAAHFDLIERHGRNKKE